MPMVDLQCIPIDLLMMVTETFVVRGLKPLSSGTRLPPRFLRSGSWYQPAMFLEFGLAMGMWPTEGGRLQINKTRAHSADDRDAQQIGVHLEHHSMLMIRKVLMDSCPPDVCACVPALMRAWLLSSHFSD